jgi:hypothetical protein
VTSDAVISPLGGTLPHARANHAGASPAARSVLGDWIVIERPLSTFRVCARRRGPDTITCIHGAHCTHTHGASRRVRPQNTPAILAKISRRSAPFGRRARRVCRERMWVWPPWFCFLPSLGSWRLPGGKAALGRHVGDHVSFKASDRHRTGWPIIRNGRCRVGAASRTCRASANPDRRQGAGGEVE